MEIHNYSEDIVVNTTQRIFDSIEKEGNPQGLCLCDQCRLDTICYALNRVEPLYIASNRGITRMEQKRHELETDSVSLIYNGLRLVNHKQRPTSHHDCFESDSHDIADLVYYIPNIIGRLFDGENFAPLWDVTVELRSEGELVPMRNQNWQNPFVLIANTPGVFTFWPAPVPAEAVNLNRVFEYSLKIQSPQYDPLMHFFKVPTISILKSAPLSMDRTFKLPDLYLFPPGESEQNG